MISRRTEKDIGNYEAKLIGPFTARQCIFLAIGAVPTAAACFAIHSVSNDPYAMFGVAVLFMTPAIFFAFGQKICFGMKPEEFLVEYYYYHFKCPRRRLYETKTLDDKFEAERLKEEAKEQQASGEKKKGKKGKDEAEKPRSECEQVKFPHKNDPNFPSFR